MDYIFITIMTLWCIGFCIYGIDILLEKPEPIEIYVNGELGSPIVIKGPAILNLYGHITGGLLSPALIIAEGGKINVKAIVKAGDNIKVYTKEDIPAGSLIRLIYDPSTGRAEAKQITKYEVGEDERITLPRSLEIEKKNNN
jgi:hypothetical protein